jgi:hypothetical protein
MFEVTAISTPITFWSIMVGRFAVVISNAAVRIGQTFPTFLCLALNAESGWESHVFSFGQILDELVVQQTALPKGLKPNGVPMLGNERLIRQSWESDYWHLVTFE